MATPVATLAPTPTPDDPRLGAWRSFIHAHARLLRRLDEELQDAHGLSLAEYDALLQLANAPGRRLRMSVLAERVLLSRSGITRLVDRLVAAGFVERSACATDARGAEAALTGKGLDAAPRGVADPPRRRPAVLPRAHPGPGPRRHRARLQRDPRRAGPRGDRRLVVRDRERLTPQPDRSRGRLYAGHERLRLSGLGAPLLPAGLRGPRPAPPLRLAAARGRAQQHLLRPPDRRRRWPAWMSATPDAFRFVVKAQRGATVRALYGDPRRSPCPG